MLDMGQQRAARMLVALLAAALLFAAPAATDARAAAGRRTPAPRALLQQQLAPAPAKPAAAKPAAAPPPGANGASKATAPPPLPALLPFRAGSGGDPCTADQTPVACPAEAASPFATFLSGGGTLCGAACQAETRAALVAISQALMPPASNYSNCRTGSDEGAVRFTATNCNGAARGGFCSVGESADLLPGDPSTYLFGGDPAAWLPSYCCWRGVVCCTSRNVTALHERCQPYSVVGLLLQHWPVDLRGELGDVVAPLLALDRWGLQRLDVSGNDIRGSLPAALTGMDHINELILGDNCECDIYMCVVCLYGTRGGGGRDGADESVERSRGMEGMDLSKGRPLTHARMRAHTHTRRAHTHTHTFLAGINGTLPADWTRMARLQHLSLGFNMLTGSLSGVRFCARGGRSPLAQLNLRANSFSGQLSVHDCDNLFFLDAQVRACWTVGRVGCCERLGLCYTLESVSLAARPPSHASSNANDDHPRPTHNHNRPTKPDKQQQDNLLQGTLPVGPDNLRLSILRLRNNRLSGTIPDRFWMLPGLYSVDLQNNLLRGTISNYVNASSFFLQILALVGVVVGCVVVCVVVRSCVCSWVLLLCVIVCCCRVWCVCECVLTNITANTQHHKQTIIIIIILLSPTINPVTRKGQQLADRHDPRGHRPDDAAHAPRPLVQQGPAGDAAQHDVREGVGGA